MRSGAEGSELAVVRVALQCHKSLVYLKHSSSLRQIDTPTIANHHNVHVCSDLVFSSFLLFIQDAKIMSLCQGEWDGSYPQEMVVLSSGFLLLLWFSLQF